MKKYLALLLAAMMMLGCLAGCGDNDTNTPDDSQQGQQGEQTTPPQDENNNSNTSDERHVGPDGRVAAEEQVYHAIYSSELTSLNYLSDGQTYNLVVGANTIDPLVENDSYGNIVPCGAESWEDELEEYEIQTEDENGNPVTETVQGQKWTFHLRQGQKWYDNTGAEMGEVTANDYVAALRYVCNAVYDCSNSYLVEGWVRGAAEYLEYTDAQLAAEAGPAKGSEVVDEENGNTQYVLDDDGTTVLQVIWNDDDTAVVDYKVMDPVGPEAVMVEAPDDYTLVYHLEKPRSYFLTVMGFGCYWPAPAAMLETWGSSFGTDNTTMWFNGAYILETLQPQQQRTYVKNVNNWDADNIHIERIEQTYNAEAASVAPGLFLQGEIDGCDIDADLLTAWQADPETAEMISPTRVTSDYSYFYTFNFEPRYDEEYGPENWVKAVNIEDFRQAIFHGLNRQLLYQVGYPNNYEDLIMNTISPANSYIYEGKDYVTYGDLEAITNRDSYDEAAAVDYMKKAIPQMQEAGVTFPITFLVQYNGDTNWGSRNALLDQSMCALFNTDELKAMVNGSDVVTFVINNFGSTGFLAGTRRAGLYSIQECNWGADFADPETWADPFEEGNSYNFFYDTTENLGMNRKTPETMALIDEYYRLVAEARAEVNDTNARYEKFAAAEAFLINHAVLIPYGITGGGYQATKMNGFEGQYASYGQCTSRYKGQWLYETCMTEQMFYDQLAAWEQTMGQ